MPVRWHDRCVEAQGRRLPWEEVALDVRRAVEAIVGGRIVSAVSQPGGFSPGVAARCVLADGRRCFVKAVSASTNPRSPEMHRREAVVAAALPAGLPVPTFLGVHDDGEWVALAFEDVEGHQPPLPWTMEALGATFEALDRVAAATTPCPVPGLAPFGTDDVEGVFHGFRKLAGGGDGYPDRIDPRLRARLDELAALESTWVDAAAGTTLLHGDLRADNLLVRRDGSLVLVDWPHATVAAAWVDVVLLLPSVGLDGGPSPSAVESVLDPFVAVDPAALDRVLAAVTGFFTHAGTLPDPPGLPTLRAFQRAQGAVAAEWLLGRLDAR
jgi:hypothetical protein